LAFSLSYLLFGDNSIDETVAAVQKAGCEITSRKHAIPSVGWVFYFVDPEGNSVGAFQDDPSAA